MTAQADPPTGEEQTLAKMSFGDHLEELRRRLMLSLIAIAVCVAVMLPFKDAVSGVYLGPYRSMWHTGFENYVTAMEKDIAARGGVDAVVLEPFGQMDADQFQYLQDNKGFILGGSFPFAKHGEKIRSLGGYKVPYFLVAIGGIEDFWTFMAASLLFSLIIASPFVLYQVWAFIAAGLYKTERSVVLRYLPFALVLLAAGTSFGYFVVVPYGLYFLVQMMNFGFVQPMFSVSNYFSLLFMMTAALGFVFQLPLVMLALSKVGVVSHAAFRKHWRYVILGMFVMSAMFTPPDPFTQVMMGVPMIGLYALGLVLTYRLDKKSGSQSLETQP